MLNVGKIEEGFVLDHIKAGKSLDIYEHLQLDKLDCTVAIIKNARSDKMGKKDILNRYAFAFFPYLFNIYDMYSINGYLIS